MFCRDSAGDIVEVERGWEWKALDVVFLEATKQGSGGSTVFGIRLQSIQVHLRRLLERRETSVRAQLKFKVGA